MVDVIDRLQKLSERGGQPWQPRALNAKHHRYIDWERETICFVVISTCGEGEKPFALSTCGEGEKSSALWSSPPVGRVRSS